MTDTHEVISAFLDGEAFEPATLGEALADPDGRALLIDLIALRHLVAESPEAVPIVRQRRGRRFLFAAAAAAIVLASLIGYSLGERQAARSADTPPTPTRVVQTTTGWQ
jgi:hypothetical protein